MYLKLLRHHAQLRCIPILSPQTEKFLDGLLECHKPLHCLEIGSAVGYSTLFLAKKIAARGGHLLSFEVSYPSYKECLYHASVALSQKERTCLTLFPFDVTSVSLEKLLPFPLDFVFVDGRKSQYLLYLKLIEPFLRPGALVIFDDCIKFASRMQDLFHYLQELSRQYEIFPLDGDDGVIKLLKP